MFSFVCKAYQHVKKIAQVVFQETLLISAARLALFGVFFQSARTKVEGFITVSDSTLFLFAEEYKLPLLSPVIAAYMATYAEHIFSVLLLLGLATRGAAAALLGMTVVIQIFVYPDAWPTHLTWATLLAYLITKGGGGVSVDRLLKRWFC